MVVLNPLLGMFAPRVVSKPSSAGVGGIRYSEFSDFLFAPPENGLVKRRNGLVGGHQDDTGGSFEAPIYFAGDSPRALLVLYCSFVDGIDRGIQIPLLYTLKNSFHLSQLAASAAIGLSLAPWLAKPVLGMITDSIPIGGLRRKPYIMGSAAVNAVSLSLIAYASMHHFGGFILPLCLLTLRTFGRAMIDAAAQGLLLEDCRGPSGEDPPNQSKTSVLVSRFQAAHRLGQFLNVCASGYVMATSTLEPIYITMAAVHLGTMLIAYSTEEQPVQIESSQREESFTSTVVRVLPEKFQELKRAVSDTPAFTNVLEYTFLSVAVPSYEAPMTYYLLDARHFSPAAISIVNIIQTTGSLIAPMIYAQFFQSTRYSTLMIGLTIASLPATLMPVVITTGLASHWGMNEVVYASVSAFTLTVVNDLALLPANVLVAQLAPKGLEGSAFSLLTVVEGTGRVFSNVVSATLPYGLGAVAPHYKNMTWYIAICTVFNVGPFSAIEGFDDVGRPVPKVEEVEESEASSEPTLGGVMNELRDLAPASPVSAASLEELGSSPIQQVQIKRN
jgi:hypothetical protein